MRAYALSHGLPLPPSGSFKEQLLAEAIFRERYEKYTLVSLFARLLTASGAVKDEYVNLLLEDYREELFQLKYNSKYKTAIERKLTEMVRKKTSDSELLAKVSAFSSGSKEKKRKKRK